MKKTQTEIHNENVGRIVRQIVRPPLVAGGDMTDVMVILESVVAGVLLIAAKPEGDEIVTDKLAEVVKKRLKELRG